MSEALLWISRFVAVFTEFKKFWEATAAADQNNTDSTAEQLAASLELTVAMKRAQAEETLR